MMLRGHEKLPGCEDGAIGEALTKDDLIFNLSVDYACFPKLDDIES